MIELFECSYCHTIGDGEEWYFNNTSDFKLCVDCSLEVIEEFE